MNSKAESQPPRFDALKWFVIVALILGGVYANSFYATEPLFYRALAGLVLLLMTAGVLLQTVMGKAAWELAKEARVEIRKVVWPTRQETVQTTMIVVGVVLFVAFVLWLIDSGLSWAIQSLIG